MTTLLLRDWGEAVPSELARAEEERRRRGEPIIDLVGANPQEEGFEFPQDLLLEIMAGAVRAARFYRPDPRGQRAAREAVARYHGEGLPPDHVILTPGTSLGYFYAFRLLAEPGDEVLVPSPTYPLFDDLARLAGLKVRRYHLHPAAGGHRWEMDPREVDFQITPRTRIIAVVSPHNPTGTIASEEELRALGEIAARRRLAVVFDEVFREFIHAGGGSAPVLRPASFGAPLTVTLNGLSKMLALPGIKAGWMAVQGEDVRWRERFLAAAEYLSDTFLPVSEVTQAALPRLLTDGIEAMRRGADLCRRRMAELTEAWRAAGRAIPAPEGGPYLTVPLPEGTTREEEEALALRLVRDHGILIHPGGLYSLPDPRLVMTCIRRPPWPVEVLGREFARSWKPRQPGDVY